MGIGSSRGGATPLTLSLSSRIAHGLRSVGASHALLALSFAVIGFVWYSPSLHYQSLLVSNGVEGWSAATCQLYAIAARPLWGAAVACIVFFVATGRGGLLGAALAHPVWHPLATLAFGAYLLHPIIMYQLLFSATAVTHYSALSVASAYSAHLVLIYACAALLYLVIEAPCAAAERVFVGAIVSLAMGARHAAGHPLTAGEHHSGQQHTASEATSKVTSG